MYNEEQCLDNIAIDSEKVKLNPISISDSFIYLCSQYKYIKKEDKLIYYYMRIKTDTMRGRPIVSIDLGTSTIYMLPYMESSKFSIDIRQRIIFNNPDIFREWVRSYYSTGHSFKNKTLINEYALLYYLTYGHSLVSKFTIQPVSKELFSI